MTQKRKCPDCEVEMEQARATAGGYRVNIKSEREEGILSKIGIDKNTPIQAHICPNCGMVNFYVTETE
jgi:hypothetical protein